MIWNCWLTYKLEQIMTAPKSARNSSFSPPKMEIIANHQLPTKLLLEIIDFLAHLGAGRIP